MPIGPFVRHLVGPRLERGLSDLYRRVFVDLDVVADVLARECPENARILDIGGGDGELINRLLPLRPDLRIDMVDIAPVVGKFLVPEVRDRVQMFPGTPIESLPASAGMYDAALVSDVMHHLPGSYRASFLSAVHAKLAPGAVMFIKDIEPGHPIASLSLFCDRHVSGDKGTALVSMQDIRELTQHLPSHSLRELGLLATNAPNYMFKLSFA